MGQFSLVHWIIVAIVVLVLFGRGRISETMGDFGKGIRSFRAGMNDDAAESAIKPAALEQKVQARQDTTTGTKVS